MFLALVQRAAWVFGQAIEKKNPAFLGVSEDMDRAEAMAAAALAV